MSIDNNTYEPNIASGIPNGVVTVFKQNAHTSTQNAPMNQLWKKDIWIEDQMESEECGSYSTEHM